MLTLQQILESDSVSTLVAKANLNFQQIAVSGGGPQGLPGEQGIPGLPGRQGPIGPTGVMGPTGSVVGIIPFASQTGGSTGPTGVAGPWNTYSYEYLNNIVGTGTNQAGHIWIDHFNDGFWRYNVNIDGPTAYTDSPYTNPFPGTTPPDGTGYFSGDGWYFYPLKNTGGGNAGDVWTNDISTYQTAPPFGTGPFNTPSPLTVKNARLLSKYGTVWISSGNGVDLAGNVDESNLTTPNLYEWGVNTVGPGLPSQPARYNSGIDRLYFKQSIDTLPYRSNVNVRSYVDPTNAPGGDPADELSVYPFQNGNSIEGPAYWVKPLYNPSLDYFSPLQYYTERRDNAALYESGVAYGTLGLYTYTSQYVGKTVGNYDYRKSLWIYSTRTSANPDENTSGDPLTEADTFNIGEMLFDVRKLTTSNQFVCSLPQDLYLSADSVDGPVYIEGGNGIGFTVTQGYVSAINGKNLTGLDITDALRNFNYGGITGTDGNKTRSSWFGSAAMAEPNNWENFDSGDGSNTSDTHIADRMYRFAGMRERAKKSFDGSNTFFLNELTFYTSQFSLTGTNVDASIDDVDIKLNEHNSLPGFYLSPFRNFGIGTFTGDDSGVFEPIARLHAHAFVRGSQFDGGNIKGTVVQRNLPAPWLSPYTPMPWTDYPANFYKGGAITNEDTEPDGSFLDFYLGHVNPETNEYANSLSSTGNPNTRAIKILDTAIRREAWNNAYGQAAIMRLGVSPSAHDTNGPDYNLGQDAANARKQFQIALSPLNANNAEWEASDRKPVGVGIQNLYPRTRVHFFGKNLQNEQLPGNEEPYTPGGAAAAGTTAGQQGVPGYYPWANYSTGQVIIDKIESSWVYNAGYKDYPYEAYGIVGLTSATGSSPATGTSGSPNAANFPIYERSNPTRNVIPWQAQTRNYAAFSPTGSAGGNATVYMHGEQYQNLFDAKSYIGFNLFRDLLNVGDDRDETRWMLGTQGDNGGSAIITSGAGDMAFVNIPTGRDGGLNYRAWEQKGLSTRDVLNNVSLILSRRGDMGLGAEPGFDYNAFPSQERMTYGYVNYVPATGDARNYGTTIYGGVMGSGTGTNKPYGLINYSGLTALYPETFATSNAAKINANTTAGEYIRFELGAEKFYGKNSRSSLNAGYGYPPNMDLTISGSDVEHYILISPSYPGTLGQLTLATDEEGRIWYVTIGNGSGGTIPFIDPVPYILGTTLPHPSEFSVGGPLSALAPFGWEVPAGACAGILNNPIYWEPNNSLTGSWGLSNVNFQEDTIGVANMRLNNFVAGEGMSPATGLKAQNHIVQRVKEARQRSPKLILSFLEADSTTIPGSKATNTSETIGTNRPVSGTAAYRKVNTVIASAQNESALREYWIPKSDNTGGTFMVWTDHYSMKEYQSGFDKNSVATSRFYLEEVVALEFVPSYTGVTAGNEYIGGTGTAAVNSNTIGRSDADAPLHVKYYNSLMGTTRYGITGATGGTQNAFTPTQWGRKVNPFGQPLVNQFSYDAQSVGSGSISGVNTGQNTAGAPVTSTAVNYTVISSTTTALSGTKPVRIVAYSDVAVENNAGGVVVQLFRGSTPIGNAMVLDAVAQNTPWSFTIDHIDYPPAGVQTYSLKQINRANPSSSLWTRYGTPANTTGNSGIVNPNPVGPTTAPSINYEEISSGIITSGGGGIASATGTMSGTGATGLALLRNVDKYYNLVQNGTNWDNGWNAPSTITNDTSQFRFKRINSDFALIDFNMTIEVKNPDVADGYVNPSTGFTNLVDAGSPRWTQYIRLAYLPSKNTGSNDRDYFMKLFGNSLSFMNWSSFNQWYPGSAVTSDPFTVGFTPGDALSNTGGPNYTMGNYYDPAHGQTIGWNGNFYDATMSTPVNHLLGDYSQGGIFGSPGTTNASYPQSGVSPFYGNSFINGNISKMLIWDDPNNYDGSKAYRFGSYMGKAYSILGNDYLSRVRNCSWRVVPRIGNEYGDGIGSTEPITVKNNSFTLEVMFDKPILHIDTPFAKTNFSSTVDGNPCFPYQYLTVSGQAMVRYSDATNTVFAGPTVTLNEQIGGGIGGLAVGDLYGGGIIGYIYQPSDPGYIAGQTHGIIVASSVLPGATWGCLVTTGATNNLLGQGILNTGAILIACPTAPAAGTAEGYVDPGGNMDWVLPNEEELLSVGANLSIGALTTLPAGFYWSSTEVTSGTAYDVKWPLNNSAASSKLMSKFILPIRYF